jgi:cation diffusion facilitator family transporter
MPSGQSSKAVFAATAASAAITLTKFLAALFGGSAAMLAEGIHSFIDTGDSLLLYLGLRRSSKPPDETHPFCYGPEVYFWSLIVAMLMFVVGGGVTIAEGVARIVRPSMPEHLGWSFAVLGLAAAFNTWSWVTALREFLAGKGDDGLWQGLEKIKDPTVVTVLFEDSASLVGVVLATGGLALAYWLEQPILDGIASLLIGGLMAAVAVGLIYQCKTLLIGESVNRSAQASLRSVVEADEAVAAVDQLNTLHRAPEDVLVNLKVRFRDGLSGHDLEKAVARLGQALRERHPEVKRLSIEPCRAPSRA